MTDSLLGVADPKRRHQLELYRDLQSRTLDAAELGRLVQGWGSQTGIFQPARTRHALWIRETLNSPYADKEPVYSPDGSWTYEYSPQGLGLAPGERRPANDHLENAWRAGLPVGVFRQVRSRRRRTTYKVWGLAKVVDFRSGRFILRGEPVDPAESDKPQGAVGPFEPYEPSPLPEDNARRQRRDRRFSDIINDLYHHRCSLCELGFLVRDKPTGLDAAHIVDVRWKSKDGRPGTSRDLRNGLLLCKNHHALFDSFGWIIDEDIRVRVADDISLHQSAAANHLLGMNGRRLRNLPDLEIDWPAQKAIEIRREKFDEFWG